MGPAVKNVGGNRKSTKKRLTLLINIFSMVGYGSTAVFQKFPGIKLETTPELTGRDQIDTEKRQPVIHILSEVVSGPLKSKHVTLLIPEDLDYDTKSMISLAQIPMSIVRLPREMPYDAFPKSANASESLEDTSKAADWTRIQFENSVVVMVLGLTDNLWWPVWFPPKSWSPKAILLFSPNPSWSVDLLLSPLVVKASSVALICPYTPRRRTSSSIVHKVWTWMVFASSRQLMDLGSWNPQSFSNWNDLFVDRFQDMSSKTMKILGNNGDRPLLYKEPDGTPSGLNTNILRSLSKWLRFQFEFKLNIAERWTRMSDLVRDGVNDIMINYATLTPERNRDFDLSLPYYYEGFGIMLENPPPIPQWMNVLYPFTWEVWLMIVCSLFISAIVSHSLYYRRQQSFIDTFVVISQSLLSNPLNIVPEGWQVRNFLLNWWMATWVVNMSYTCNLIAVLTVPVFPVRIQTAQELAESNYRLCMLDYGEFVPEALKASTHTTLAALGRQLDLVPLIDENPFIGEEGCVELVVAGSHAHTETYSYVKLMYSDLGHGSTVYALKEHLYPGYLSFLITKNTPWKYKFDVGMQRLIECGLVRRWYTKAMDELLGNSQHKDKGSTQLSAFTIAHLQGPFLLLAIGLFISLLVMAGEVTFG